MFRIFIFLWPISLVAYTLTPSSLENLLPFQDEISHIRIIEAKVHEFEYNSERYVCGISYKAKLIEKIWSSEGLKDIDFQAHSPLATDQEYIVFFRNSSSELPPGMKVVSEPDYFQSEQYKTCKSELPGLVGSMAYEFYPFLRDEKGNLEWLQKEYLSPDIPLSIKTTKIKCISEGAGDESPCERIGEPVLIHWPSLRLFIQIHRGSDQVKAQTR